MCIDKRCLQRATHTATREENRTTDKQYDTLVAKLLTSWMHLTDNKIQKGHTREKETPIRKENRAPETPARRNNWKSKVREIWKCSFQNFARTTRRRSIFESFGRDVRPRGCVLRHKLIFVSASGEWCARAVGWLSAFDRTSEGASCNSSSRHPSNR